MESLRSSQVKALQRMLRFNRDDNGSPVEWKVLIFDSSGHDIVSSVLRTSDLSKAGVTLYLLLDAQRHAIPDVPALYFVEPTEHNIERIGMDVNKGLYSSFSLNFTRPLTRAQLEDLAAKTLNSSARISQVVEQHLQFTVLEPEIFSLELPNTYKVLSDPRSQESEIETRVNDIADRLFCVLLTQQVVPVLRASRGNAAEMVASALDTRLRSLLANRRSELPRQMLERRVVLTVLDRQLDLVSMLAHSWTYQSLINDTCDLRRNAIRVPGTPEVYDIDHADQFWRANHSLPFPEVADNVDAFLNKYKDDAKKAAGDSSDPMDPTSASAMASALTQVPELTQRKKAVDMHMNIATQLLKAIGDRGLAQLFEAEETATRQTPKTMLELIKNPEMGTPEDKLRLCLVYLIAQQPKSEDFSLIENELLALAPENPEIANALKYIKRTKEISRMSLATGPAQPAAKQVSPALFQRITGSLTEKLQQGVGDGVGNLISGLKNLLPENKDLPATRIVQQLLDPVQTDTKSKGIADDFLYFDPHETRGQQSRPPPKRSSYDQAIVFVVGGGNYAEYANVTAKFGDRVLYGSTDIPTPHEFVKECAELGEHI